MYSTVIPVFELDDARIALVGPLPPPPGGMANQTQQLSRLLSGEGARVDVVRTNAPCQPGFIENVRGVRALFRFVPYWRALRRASGEATHFHIMANSGWAWHLFAAPALYVAHQANVPIVLNYRGGDAERFFVGSFSRVQKSLRWADAIVVPSRFLRDVFARFGVSARVVPNIVDLDRFRPVPARPAIGSGPRVLIARSLEPIYDIATGIRSFAELHATHGEAVLSVAGSGPEAERLRRLSAEVGVESAVRFLGQVDNDAMPALYAEADIALNPSLVDNQPNSILEALASGVPVVSTWVGGVPALVEHDRDAVLVPPGDPEAMASAMLSLWSSAQKREELRRAGLDKAKSFGWDIVREQWIGVYGDVLARGESRKA